jgi:hypothetical protein
MTDCNATLTTATVGPCRCDLTIGSPDYLNHDPVSLFNEDRGEYEHVTLHTMTCTGKVNAHHSHEDGLEQHLFVDAGGWFRVWRDDWDGATPHVEQLVSEAEVEAAMKAYTGTQTDGWKNTDSSRMLTVLEAAAKARQATEGNNP